MLSKLEKLIYSVIELNLKRKKMCGLIGYSGDFKSTILKQDYWQLTIEAQMTQVFFR